MNFRGLGSAVGGSVGGGDQAVLARDEYNASADALLDHDPIGGPADQKITGRQYRQVAVPQFQAGLLQGRSRRNPGVGNQDVEAAVALHSAINGSLHYD